MAGSARKRHVAATIPWVYDNDRGPENRRSSMTDPFTILEWFANWFVKRDLSVASIVN